MKLHGLLILLVPVVVGCGPIQTSESAFQKDADVIRLEHLVYWTGLIEEYHEKVGRYPFQDKLVEGGEIGLVRIITRAQSEYLKKGGKNYVKALDFNTPNRFLEPTVGEFIAEVENKLRRRIDEKYDIQKVPTRSPIGYYYFFTADGYLLWVTCFDCGTTPISTLLFDGITPTVNIVSKGMKGQVTKAHTREEMLGHPIFQKWMKNELAKENYMRGLVEQHHSDSKN